jgi:hypothetical protein
MKLSNVFFTTELKIENETYTFPFPTNRFNCIDSSVKLGGGKIILISSSVHMLHEI